MNLDQGNIGIDMAQEDVITSPEYAPELAEETYDPSVAFRSLGPVIAVIVTGLLVSMSVYHYYASGFGLIRELVHRCIHLSFVLGLIFLVFGFSKRETRRGIVRTSYRFDWVPSLDILIAIISVVS